MDGVGTAVSSDRRSAVRWALPLCVALAALVGAFLWFRDPAPTVVDHIEISPGALQGWNVVLISMDTVRRDRLHCYGREEIDTPVVDRLARKGVRFDQAITPVPMTLPGHATMLTGLNPQHHGARVNGMFKLDATVPTFQGTLKRHGYATAGFIAAFVLDRQFGLSRGFDHYDDDLSSGERSYHFSYRERSADKVNASVETWLRKQKEGPFFLFVHYFDPHWPHNAPEPFSSRYRDNHHGAYDAEIAWTDQQVGKLLGLLDELDVRDRTLVIVTSDHGEGLEEHNEQTHSLLLYDTTLRVPLIFSGPDPIPHNRLVTSQVGLIDIMPTVLDLLGVPVPEGVDGVSLLKPLPAEPRPMYIETLGSSFLHGWAPLVGVRRDDYKFVLAPRCELYDLRADPNELRNLFDTNRTQAVAMHKVLQEMVGGDPHLVTKARSNLPMDEETKRKLSDLGYLVTASAPAGSQPTTTQEALPDPKDMILAQRWVLQAQTMIQTGQYEEALLLINPYLEKHENDGLALHVAGEAYQKLGKIEESLKAYRRAAELSYEPASALARVGTNLLLLERLDEAEQACRKALEMDPHAVNALLTIGWIRHSQNRDDEAMAMFRRVLEEGRGTHDAPAWLSIGKLLRRQGKFEEARRAIEKALAIDPTLPGAANELAEMSETKEDKQASLERLRKMAEEKEDPFVLLKLGTLEAELGRNEEAIHHLERTLVLQPDNLEAHRLLGRVLLKENRTEDALHHLREAIRLAPGHSKTWARLAMALMRLRRYEEALEACENSASLAPKSAGPRYNVGIVLIRLKRYDEAVASFREAVRIDPNHASSHYNLGQILRATGRAEEGQKHIDRALQLNPKLARKVAPPRANAGR